MYKKIKVSIIVTNYNYSKFIKRCLNSCFNQTFDKNSYEVIFVDDFSSDNSLDVAKKFLNKKKINFNNHLFSGDDYQIVFTVKKKHRDKVISYARMWNQKITLIGKITNRKDNFIKLGQKLMKIDDYRGYIHHFK